MVEILRHKFLSATRNCRNLLRGGAVENFSQNSPIITLFLLKWLLFCVLFIIYQQTIIVNGFTLLFHLP